MEKSIIITGKKNDMERIEKKMDNIEEISMEILRAIDSLMPFMEKHHEHKADVDHTGYNADNYESDGDASDGSE